MQGMKKTFALMLVLLLGLWSVGATAQQTAEDMVFPDDVTIEPMRYHSPTVMIDIEKLRAYDSDAYVAHVRLKDMASFAHAFAHDKFEGGVRKLGLMAKENKALLAITGDYAKELKVGIKISNGVTYRKTVNNKRDIGVIYKNGEMDVLKGAETTYNSLTRDKEVLHTMLFGPNLLKEDGTPITSSNSKIAAKNPRAAIGYVAPNHFLFVAVDGRSKQNRGMTMVELSRFMFEQGAKKAYNLDGGQSAALWFNGSIVNAPYHGGRQLADMYFIRQGE